MEYLLGFLNNLLPVLYVSCLFLYAYSFFHPEATLRKSAVLVFRFTLLVHLTFLALVSTHYGRPPMANLFEAISFLAFTVAAVYAYIEFHEKETSGGMFVLFLVFMFQLISSGFVTHKTGDAGPEENRAVIVHVGVALASYSALSLSALFGAMYLMLYHDIKNRHFGVIYNRLPSLDRLNRLVYQAALVGFVLLTLSIISGFVWVYTEPDEFRDQLTKILVVMFAWVIYGALIAMKTIRKWQGPRLARYSLLGFIAAILSLFVAFRGVD